MRFATPDQYAAIRNAIEPHFALLVGTLLQTGARGDEVAALRGTDVARRGNALEAFPGLVRYEPGSAEFEREMYEAVRVLDGTVAAAIETDLDASSETLTSTRTSDSKDVKAPGIDQRQPGTGKRESVSRPACASLRPQS